MLDALFRGLFDTDMTRVISILDFLFCVFSALILGILLMGMYSWRTQMSRSFAVTLALLPATVCVVIMVVNGNVGTGVAVAGAFSLVRFRSVPGTGREIGALFVAMAAGVMVGMGYIGYAVLFSAILGTAHMAFARFDLRMGRQEALFKTLRITIPEDLEYTEVFSDLMDAYTSSHELLSVKTTNMGSLFRLTYDITLRMPDLEKKFIDALRCRNGNLEIMISSQETMKQEL